MRLTAIDRQVSYRRKVQQRAADVSHTYIVLWVETIRLLRAEGCGLPGEADAANDRNRFSKNGKGSTYSTTERTVPELIPVVGSQPAGDVSHKPGGRLPLLSNRPAVTVATLKMAATNFAAW